jgi:uncharacterized protein YwbE
LYQDYVTKKDLTTSVIEGKLTSGQAKDILTAARPPETILDKIGIGVGTNVATIALLAGAGYLAFLYFTSKKATA